MFRAAEACLCIATWVSGASAEVVHGTLIDGHGKPVVGASIQSMARRSLFEWGAPSELRFFAETDSKGHFAFEKLPFLPTEGRPMECLVRLHDQAHFGIVNLVRDNQRVRMTPGPTTLRVSVTDDLKKPLSGASVTLHGLILPSDYPMEKVPWVYRASWTSNEQPSITLSDSHGHAEISGLPGGTRVRYSSGADETILPKRGKQFLTLQVPQLSVLRGQVLFEGKPIPHAKVQAVQYLGHGPRWVVVEASTDENGHYEMQTGAIWVQNLEVAPDPGHPELVGSSYAWPILGPGTELNCLDITLRPKVAIDGALRSDLFNQPIANASVQIEPAHARGLSSQFWEVVTTDSQGHFSTKAPVGRYRLSLRNIGSRWMTSVVARDLEVNPLHNEPVEFQVPEAVAEDPIVHLSGTVIWPDGKPVQRALVQAVRTFVTTWTDSQGKFRFDSPITPGDVIFAEKGEAMSKARVVVWNHSWPTMTLDSKFATIHGLVVGPDGKPLSDVNVGYEGVDPKRRVGLCVTGGHPDGSFSLYSLDPEVDHYTVTVGKPGYEEHTFENIRLVPGQQTELPPLSLGLATRVIEGHVLGVDGKPAQGVPVDSRLGLSVKTDKRGFFRFTRVPKGAQQLWVWNTPDRAEASVVVQDNAPNLVVRLKQRELVPVGINIFGNVGLIAPALQVSEWLTSNPLRLDQLKGKMVVLDMWSATSNTCVSSLRRLDNIAKRYAAKDVVVVGIHLPTKDSGEVRQVLKTNGVTYPNAIDQLLVSGEGATARAFGFEGVPHLVLIDRDGKIQADTHEIDALEKRLKMLLAR